jgi:hypothetical protein
MDTIPFLDPEQLPMLEPITVKPVRLSAPEFVTDYHLCLDLRGALMNWSDRQFKGAFTHDDGRKMTAREAKLALMEEIAKGRKVIPCAPCNNFDYERGCMGHRRPVPEEESEMERARR